MSEGPDVHGSAEPAFARVRRVFADVVAEQHAAGSTGAAVALWHDGRFVVDLWGGYADAGLSRPWGHDTFVMPYSVTKPFAAVCALVLADRGLLDLDAPLATYWPGLTARTTMRQVLGHQSGLVALDRPAPTEAFFDWDLMCDRIAEQEPMWEPGTACGESALLYGHQIGEVVRRVDGRTLGTFLREEVCGPHGIDFHVGLREDEVARAADLTGYDEEFRRGVDEGPAVLRRALANPPGALDPEVVNSRAWRTAEVAAVNGHGTARAVAGLYVALQRDSLLSEGMLRELTSPSSVGRDRVLDREADWGLGVGVEEDGYGMGGLGGSLGWWSHQGPYAFGFVTGQIASHDRSDRVESAARECLGLPAL